jgi:hypothetical protein
MQTVGLGPPTNVPIGNLESFRKGDVRCCRQAVAENFRFNIANCRPEKANTPFAKQVRSFECL